MPRIPQHLRLERPNAFADGPCRGRAGGRGERLEHPESGAEVDQFVVDGVEAVDVYKLAIHAPGRGPVVFGGQPVDVEGQHVVPRRHGFEGQPAVVQHQLLRLVQEGEGVGQEVAGQAGSFPAVRNDADPPLLRLLVQ